MGQRSASLVGARAAGRRRSPADGIAVDQHWARDARFASYCAVAFAGPAALVDRGAGEPAWTTLPLCALLVAVAFMILLPARVTAGEGWLAVGGLRPRRLVRTDALVRAQLSGAFAVRLVLRDTDGRRVALDARVLTANPLLWHLLDNGVRASRRGGTLPEWSDGLRGLRDRIGPDPAHAVLAVPERRTPPGRT